MKCSVCGGNHDELPDIGSSSPFHWRDELEDVEGSLLTEDLCIVDAEDYFVRGVIEIPIIGSDDYFGWGVWVSLKKENFEVYRDNYDTDAIGPFFGWLATQIDFFPVETLNLPTTVKFVGDGTRPKIFINDCEHRLRSDQKSGITLEQAWETVHHYTAEA
ncbi:MAG: DUF2199 domain-containing protein [Akkermansiaceae bacterium]